MTYQITDVAPDKSVYSYNLCKKCGDQLVEKINKKKEIDLSNIKTPEELLNLICGVDIKNTVKNPCPGCGWTNTEFNIHGRFGCSKCYDHFSEKMKELVYPYHNASSHVGKTPKEYLKKKWNSTLEEKSKLLKLRLAKAIEVEEYDKATQINLELQEVIRQMSSYEDQ